jgi:hypothetical protein
VASEEEILEEIKDNKEKTSEKKIHDLSDDDDYFAR